MGLFPFPDNSPNILSKFIFLFSTSPLIHSLIIFALVTTNSFWTEFLCNLILLSEPLLPKILNIPSKIYPTHFLRVKLDIFWIIHFLCNLLFLKLCPPRKKLLISHFIKSSNLCLRAFFKLHPKCDKIFKSNSSSNGRAGVYHGLIKGVSDFDGLERIFVKFCVLAQKSSDCWEIYQANKLSSCCCLISFERPVLAKVFHSYLELFRKVFGGFREEINYLTKIWHS